QIVEQTPRIAADREVDTQPTLGFQRVIQRAIVHVQSTAQKEVTGANVLVAIFGEKDSHAVYFLQKQSITKIDVTNYLSQGITKTPQSRRSKPAEDSPATGVESEADFAGGPLDRELEAALHSTFAGAREKRHEFITVEHLLLALLDNPIAAEVLRACGADINELRKQLNQHIAEHTPLVAEGRKASSQATLGFHRVIERAVLHMQASGRKELTGANVLVAIFGEKDSHAVYFLQSQGVARVDVITY